MLTQHAKTVSYVMAVLGGGDNCNSSLKMLQPTPYHDSNESSYPTTSSIEAKSCGVFIAHQGIYVKCVSS